MNNWKEIARPEQLPPEGWTTFDLSEHVGKRAWGKTRALVEIIKDEIEKNPNIRILVVGWYPMQAKRLLTEKQMGRAAFAVRKDRNLRGQVFDLVIVDTPKCCMAIKEGRPLRFAREYIEEWLSNPKKTDINEG